jgi:hypothetical protein
VGIWRDVKARTWEQPNIAQGGGNEFVELRVLANSEGDWPKKVFQSHAKAGEEVSKDVNWNAENRNGGKGRA